MRNKHDINEVPHIVKVIYNDKGERIGAIADNYCVKTKEEVDAILERCGKIYGESLQRKAERAALAADPHGAA